MVDAVSANPGQNGGQPATVTVTAPHPTTFHDVLSALNPLQYLPVVGTIYRAITGDAVPDSLRTAGSLLFSGLVAGPIGLATTAATTILEKATGIDPEKIGQSLLASLGIGASAPAPAEAPAQTPAPAPAVAAAWSPKEFAANGVTTATDGTLQQGDLRGADVLNAMELGRLGHAIAAYGEAGTPAQASLDLAA